MVSWSGCVSSPPRRVVFTNSYLVMEGTQPAGVVGRGARRINTEGYTMADGTVTEGAVGAAGAGTDAELIRSLQEALAVEQVKNQVLMEQLMKAEDALANKDLLRPSARFDVVTFY
jgi:hypothetical protein